MSFYFGTPVVGCRYIGADCVVTLPNPKLSGQMNIYANNEAEDSKWYFI